MCSSIMRLEQLCVFCSKCLMKTLDFNVKKADDISEQADSTSVISDNSDSIQIRKCWICYEISKNETLIQPCNCKGDIGSVHEECLKKWLTKRLATPDSLFCKICGVRYKVEKTKNFNWRKGFTNMYWIRLLCVITCMCLVPVGVWVLEQYKYPCLTLMAGAIAVGTEYACICYIANLTVAAYLCAKMSTLKIVGTDLSKATVVDIPVSDLQVHM